MLHPTHPCLSAFSGPSIPQLIAASFPLSDLRCFGFLSSAAVLDSDYSASVLPFHFFPVPPHSCFPGARLGSRLLGFLFLSGLVSRAFLPDSCTQLRCSFPFTLPCFAPTAVPQVLSRCPFPLSLPRFPPSLRPDFSCLPSGFLYSASLFVSFRSSPLRSHSRSTGAYLPFRFLSSASLSVFSASDSLSFVRSSFASSYSAFCSSFPFLPGSALQLLSRCPASALASSVSSFSPA